MSTSLTGTTEEYTELIRSGLIGAGIGVNTQLRRDQAALITQATGFSEDQIQRIIDGQEVDLDLATSLDTERNSLLKQQVGILISIAGAGVGSGIAKGMTGGLFGKVAGAGLKKMTTRALIGGALGATGVGLAASLILPMLMNDFVYRPGQPPVPFNPKDTLIGVKNPAALGGGVDPNALAGAMASAMSGMTVEMKDVDKAIMRLPEIAIRNA